MASETTLAPRSVDRFGNTVDPEIGYARGKILGSSVDEVRRLDHARALTREWAAVHGPDSLTVFTGISGHLGIEAADTALCNEWIGPALVGEDLKQAALAHLGGTGAEGFGMLARSSAAMVAWLSLLATDAAVISVVPAGGRSHSSVHHGARLARAGLLEVAADQLKDRHFRTTGARCVVVTPVTSSLEHLGDDDLTRVVGTAHRHGALVLLDDAYGARLRPILYGGSPSLSFGADAVMTNSDKAGMRGPRGALLAGEPELVRRLVTWAAERGLDARGPILTGALRALQNFRPQDLIDEAVDGRHLGEVLAARLGGTHVHRGDLGPTISEEDALELLHARGSGRDLVPCEAAGAIAVQLLRRFGIVTVNTHAQPGARVSLRLKPVLGHLARAGGAKTVSTHVYEAIGEVAEAAQSPSAVRRLLLGDNHPR